jgi:hypothetical protein
MIMNLPPVIVCRPALPLDTWDDVLFLFEKWHAHGEMSI